VRTWLLNKVSTLLKVEINCLIKKSYVQQGREYQLDCLDFGIKSSDSVLDIGSGAYPFKYATHLVDLYTEDNFHRGGEALVHDDRPLLVADIENLPYNDNQFDFAYCSHVLEHVSNPGAACKEIMRVSKRGYIETPTRTSDIMLNYTYIHTWHISMVGKTLIFMPYSQREKQGTGMNAFEMQKQSPYQNDFSRLTQKNMDLFCNMMLWEDTFDYFVFNNEGNLVDSSK